MIIQLDELDSSILRNIDAIDFSDIIAATRTGPASWVYADDATVSLEIPFDVEPTVQQRSLIIARITTINQVEENLRLRAIQAVTDNTNWKNNALPQIVSAADAILGSSSASALEKQLAQGIKALANQTSDICAQNNAIIRVLFRQLD